MTCLHSDNPQSCLAQRKASLPWPSGDPRGWEHHECHNCKKGIENALLVPKRDNTFGPYCVICGGGPLGDSTLSGLCGTCARMGHKGNTRKRKVKAYWGYQEKYRDMAHRIAEQRMAKPKGRVVPVRHIEEGEK